MNPYSQIDWAKHYWRLDGNLTAEERGRMGSADTVEFLRDLYLAGEIEVAEMEARLGALYELGYLDAEESALA